MQLASWGTPSIDPNGITPVFSPSDIAAAPMRTQLLQSYPNPFNPDVWIPYELGEDAAVSVEIYNISGQLVRTLLIGMKKRGQYIAKDKAVYWDGRAQSGERAASGVYFYGAESWRLCFHAQDGDSEIET